MRPLFQIALAAALLLCPVALTQVPRDALTWGELAALPGTPGLGGPFVGSQQGALIVAGGANFPDAPPWEGGLKVWHDAVYVLDDLASAWDRTHRLIRPRAYGAAISTDAGLLLIGGCDAERCFADVTLLAWDPKERRISEARLAPLPEPASFLAAARCGDEIFVLAGQRSSDPADLGTELWTADLAAPLDELRWRSCQPCPGGPRIKALLTAQAAGPGAPQLFLFGGERPLRRGDGEIELHYVRDAWRFDPREAAGDRWSRLADLPQPLAAACGLPYGQSHVLVFSGSHGHHVTAPIQERPEFTREVLAYHTITDTWTPVSAMPEGLVTTGAAAWRGRFVIPGGELRPGVRSPRVFAAEPAPSRASLGIADTTVLVLYLAALVAMGIFFARREKGTADFFLAGRRIPWWAAGLSVYATQLSAITFIATPALAYSSNWLVYPALITILFMAPVVVRFYLPFFRRLGVTTAYEYLERRFDLSVRLFGSASFIAFQLVRMAIVVYLPALALAAVTGIDIYLCILAMGVLAALYTVLGGIEAVIWTDVLQVVVLLGGVLLSLAVILGDQGGIQEVLAVARADGKLDLGDWRFSFTELTTWTVLLGGFFLNFGPYTTDQAVIQRYLTTKDERGAARGIYLNGLLAIPFGLLFFALGTALYVFFKSHPALLEPGMQNDEIFPLFVAGQLPAGLSGLVIAGVFAASMSSLDSSMHSVATAFTNDWYRRFLPGASDRRCLKVARIVTVLVGVLGTAAACGLATFDIRSLFLFFQKALGLISSGLVGIFILGIFTRRARSIGALLGALISTALLAYIAWFTRVHFFLYAVIGVVTAVVTGYLLSLCFRGRTPDLEGLTIHSLESARDAHTTDPRDDGERFRE